MAEEDEYIPQGFGKEAHQAAEGVVSKYRKGLYIDGREEIAVPYEGKRRILKEIGPQLPKREVQPNFPVTQEFHVGQNEKGITSIKVNESGFKFYTGCEYSTVCYYDLSSMHADGIKCLTSIQLDETYSIIDIDCTQDESLIAIASGSPIFRLFDQKGLKKSESRRGDMYVYDTTNTWGHTAAVTSLQFRPGYANQLATCSADGTLRFWTTNHLEQHNMIYRLGQQGGVRYPGHAMRWSADGNGVFVVANDSTLAYYDNAGHSRSATLTIRLPNIGGAIAVSNNGFHVATRELTTKGVQMWDIRSPNEPLWNILSDSRGHAMYFSPSGENLLIGESIVKQSKKGGSIKIVSTLNGELLDEVLMSSGVGVNCLSWHQKNNQIYAGCSDGITRILFDRELSKKGALRALENGISFRRETDDAVIGQLIPKFVDPETERVIHGFWFPFTDQETREKRQRAAPVAPLWGEGFRGRIAIHPVQRELEELGAVDKPDDTDIIESIRRHHKGDEIGYFTKVRETEEQEEKKN